MPEGMTSSIPLAAMVDGFELCFISVLGHDGTRSLLSTYSSWGDIPSASLSTCIRYKLPSTNKL